MNLQGNIRDFVEGRFFQNSVIWAIILCSILLGIETYYPPNMRIFIFFDIIFSSFFILEILLRIIADGNIFRFFKLIERKKSKSRKNRFQINEYGFWNWFDFLIVVFTSISLFKHFVEHPEFLVVSRLFRTLRILRLLEVSEDLKQVERKIVSIIPTVFSFMLLLGILIYIYSIIGIYLFEHKDFNLANFTDLPAAFMTLFQLMTLDNWSEVMQSAESSLYSGWLVKGFFISFVIFTAIISFNVFVAVLTTQVHERMIKDRDKVLRKREERFSPAEIIMQKQLLEITAEMRNLRKELAAMKGQLKPPKDI
jgi:voltage-gated sodium channel